MQKKIITTLLIIIALALVYLCVIFSVKSVSFKDADNKEVKKETNIKDILKLPPLSSQTRTVDLNEEFNIKLGEKVVVNDAYGSGSTFKLIGVDEVCNTELCLPVVPMAGYEIQTFDVKDSHGGVYLKGELCKGSVFVNDENSKNTCQFGVLIKKTYSKDASVILKATGPYGYNYNI
ncbi:hypothetical protein K8Q94_03040 [Candidatus Nomurabacteria bacterium]|nr:hypothetical protein [Candidatus Nomurabacteria bacterium]